MQTNSDPLKAHPFELAGMGVGPFKFVGLVSIPSAGLAEANPMAYSNALAALPHDIIGGCGTCYNCGQAITHVCIIENSTGQRYGVGTDCVAKTGDPCLGDKAKVAVARLQREQRRAREDAKREAKRQQWLASTCNERGETNAQRLEREQAEADAARKAQRQVIADKWGFIAPYLHGPEGGFCDSIKQGLRAGNEPRGRAVDILAEIYAKANGGRRGSKGYEAAYEEFWKRIDETAPEVC